MRQTLSPLPRTLFFFHKQGTPTSSQVYLSAPSVKTTSRSTSKMPGAIEGMANNYNTGSATQRAAIDASRTPIKKAIEAFDINSSSSFSLTIVDFGSAHGINSIHGMKTILSYLGTQREVLVVHNDLPTNDWSTLFKLLADDNSYKSVISARSFYEQCLPSASVSIAYCASSLHWLSEKPCNALDHVSAQLSCDEQVRADFKKHSRNDYSRFLQHRARELHKGAVLILVTVCPNDLLCSLLELLFQCAQSLAITEEELADYTVPAYFRLPEEYLDMELLAENSLQLVHAESCPVLLPMSVQFLEGQSSVDEFAHSVRSFVQGWSENVLRQALTNGLRTRAEVQPLIDSFWAHFEEKVNEQPHLYAKSLAYMVITLKKDS